MLFRARSIALPVDGGGSGLGALTGGAGLIKYFSRRGRLKYFSRWKQLKRLSGRDRLAAQNLL